MNRFRSIQSLITSSLLLLLGGFSGYYFGVQGYEVGIKKDIPKVEIINKTSEMPSEVDFLRFWEVWDAVNTQHIKRPLNPEALVDGAIHGMVNAIEDPFTTYLNVSENTEATNSLNGTYEGIGAQLGFDEEDRLIIVAPLDGSPARASGVKAGDRIMAIEGQTTEGISVTEAVSKIRGPAGSVSNLTLARNGLTDPFEVNITRDEISIESVIWEDKGDGIVYIRLSRFGETTNTEWSNMVNEISSQMPNLSGIILDVRNNPGGFLESSVFAASEFISRGVVVSQDFADGKRFDYKVDHSGKFTDNSVPLTVLINEGSASASEIAAAALKEKRNAVLVGKRTFGKGSVQRAQEFSNGSSVHITIAKWITPDGNWLDKQNADFSDSVYNEFSAEGEQIIGGISPDFVVEITDEDIETENDPQLNKAIEILREEI